MAGPQEPGSQEPAQGVDEQMQSASATVRDAAQSARREAASFAEAAKDKASEKVEAKTGEAGEALSDVAQAIRRAGDELSRNDRSTASQMMTQAADGLEGLARALSQKKPEELLGTVRDYGRDNPTALFAGSVLAGLALGRFLRASDRPREADGPEGSAHKGPMGDSRHMADGAAAAPRLADAGGQDGGTPAAGAASDGTSEVAKALGRDPRSGDDGAAPMGRE